MGKFEEQLKLILFVMVILLCSGSVLAQEIPLQVINSKNASQITQLSSTTAGWSVKFAGDGSNELISANRSELSLWKITEANQFELINRVSPDLSTAEQIGTIALSRDGKYVALSSVNDVTYDGRIRLLDLKTGNMTTLVHENWGISVGTFEPVRQLEFSPDGQVLARTEPFSVQLWNVGSKEMLGYMGRSASGETYHTGDIDSIAFSPNGNLFASGGGNYDSERRDRSIRFWDTKSLKQIAVLNGHTDDILRVVFSPDSSLLASSSADRTIRLWNTNTYQTVRIIQTHYWQYNSDLAFSSDGSLVASPALGGTIILWDTQTGQQITTLGTSETEKYIASFAFSPDGKFLVSADSHNVITLWGIPISSGN